MLIEDSQYNTSGKLPKYEFKKTDLLEIIKQFEITKDRMENIILQQNRTITLSLDYFGTSKTKNTIEEVYELNIRNVELICDMCENGIKAVNGFIDEIENEIGTLSGTTKFDLDDIRRTINKLNQRISSIIERINTNLFNSLESKLGTDDEQQEIEIHNNRVYQNLSSKISSNNHKSMELLDSLTDISKRFDQLDGNWCFNLGREVNVEGLKFVNLRRFSDDIKSTNKVLENVDLRTPKEVHEDEVKGGISKGVHWTLEVGATIGTAVAPLCPPAGFAAKVIEGANIGFYFLEGEFLKGFVNGVLAAPLFEGLNKAGDFIGDVGRQVGSEMGEFFSHVRKSNTNKVFTKLKTDKNNFQPISSTEVAISQNMNILGEKRMKNAFGRISDGTFESISKSLHFENAELYDTVSDLTWKPATSAFFNSSDGDYKLTEAEMELVNYMIAFWQLVVKY